MIYSKFGGSCEVVRLAKNDDVKRLERRRRDRRDTMRIGDGCYLVMRYTDERQDHVGTKEFLADVCYLKADGGLREIADALRDACERVGVTPPQWAQTSS